MKNYMDTLLKNIDLSQNKPLNDIVYEGLKNAIIMSVIPVGERINEQVYSECMNISRTPIRNAINRLTKEGILQHIPKYGVIVKKVSIADVEEIYKIRVALDVLAASTAMDEMTSENLDEMLALLNKTKLSNGLGDVSAVTTYFTEFNNLIYKFARMTKLEGIVLYLKQYYARFRDISLYDYKRRQIALDEHFVIYEVFKKKDKDLLIKIIEEHLEFSKKFIIDQINREENQFKR